MNKREFLKTTGLLGAASLLPVASALTGQKTDVADSGCVLIPTETAGPFPLDLTANAFYFRKDVREGRPGVQLNMKFRIIGNGNCLPMPNVRVNIWHCDKDGVYSGYGDQAGQTFMRGYQLTDANGEAGFTTIFPGWYPGRITHIHFQVYVSSAYAAISQLGFDTAAKNAIYTANPSLYPKGPDPMTFASDNVFADGYQYQVATLTPGASAGGYESFLEVVVKGNGTTGMGHIEKENAKQFSLGQNYPNPFANETTIPFSLSRPADVVLEVWELSGRKVASITKTGMPAGDQAIKLNMKALGLATASYVYQLEVRNAYGSFRDCRMMTGK